MIPEEIVRFFQNGGGHSLLIKGEPGSGKTTFALEILNQLKGDFEIHYISSRVADDVLFMQFPWLKEVLNKKVETNKRKISRAELSKLEGLIEEGMIEERAKILENEAFIEVGSMMPEIDEIYDFVESIHPKKALVCVDSIDGLSEKYGVPAEKLLYTLQKDLVEGGFANIIFVLESSSFENIEYLGDGVISLHHEPWDSSWKRYMIIKKLRGSPIKRSKYIYTLHGGHLRVLNYENFSLDSVEGIDGAELEKYLDSLKSSSLNFIISPNFPVELIQLLILTMVKKNDKNTLIVPPITYPGFTLKKHADKFTKGRVKIAGFGKENADIILEGRDMLIELSPDIIEYHVGSNSLAIISIDALKSMYRELTDLPRLIETTKMKHRVILLTPSKVENDTTHLGVERNVYLENMDGIPVIKDSNSVMALITRVEKKRLLVEMVPLM